MAAAVVLTQAAVAAEVQAASDSAARAAEERMTLAIEQVGSEAGV